MKSTFCASLFLIVGIFSSCSNKASIWSKKYCQLERLEFQEVTDTVRVKRNGETKTGVLANGKVILSDKISVDSVGALLQGGTKTFIDKTTYKTVSVSQDFYEKYSTNRKGLCDIVEGVKSGIIKTEEGQRRAENLYLELVELFAGNEKKKI